MTAELGTVSSGTMRKEDLIPAFIDTLRHHNPEHALIAEYDALPDELDELTEEQEEQTDYMLEELFDALNDYAPAFCYFGAHPGNGTDYGFWFDSDALDDARRYGECIAIENHLDPEEVEMLITAADAEYACHVNDHGNVTIYDCNGQIILEIV